MDGVHSHFTPVDWAVLIGYLLLTTWVGHRLRGRQATIHDFFLAGRSLPWPAVSASIIATEISALTFIGVPGMVFAMGGNFTYLQWAIGSILARCIVGWFLVRLYYEKEIFSPYDFMADRLGAGVQALTTALFTVGSILGQSVRVLVTALILKTVTPFDMTTSIAVIAAFSILWTLMGGMTTVIWTDAMQFCLFVLSGFLAFFWILGLLPGGWEELVRVGSGAGKFTLLDWSLDPDVQFTMWVALIAMPFQNLAAFGADQLNAQRMFCCRNAGDARKAIIFSSFSQVVTILMLMVGAGLYVYYQSVPPTPAEAELFRADRDNVFPVWITTVLPPGLTGLVLAGAFAAAISSLDSALTALSQTTLSLLHGRENLGRVHSASLMRQSRILVIFWGIALSGTAVLLHIIKEAGDINLISLAFGMVAYTYGPLLGILLLAWAGFRPGVHALWVGLWLSVGMTLLVRPDLFILLESFGLVEAGTGAAIRPRIAFPWLYPMTCAVTFLCGCLSHRLARARPSAGPA